MANFRILIRKYMLRLGAKTSVRRLALRPALRESATLGDLGTGQGTAIARHGLDQHVFRNAQEHFQQEYDWR